MFTYSKEETLYIILDQLAVWKLSILLNYRLKLLSYCKWANTCITLLSYLDLQYGSHL